MTTGSWHSETIRTLPDVHRPIPVHRFLEVLENRPDGDIYRRLVLQAPEIAERAQAGQFVMLSIPESPSSSVVLPRPMAIHRRRGTTIEVVFAVRGRGTQALARLEVGDSLGVTGPLGRGFQILPGSPHLLVIGRGIGICSVMGVVEDAVIHGLRVSVVLSGRSPDAVVGLNDLHTLRVQDRTAVTDSEGTSTIPELEAQLRHRFREQPPDQVFVCGSQRLERMSAGLASDWNAPLQVALEAHMACGIGYCHGCAVPNSDAIGEAPMICFDGPVFEMVSEQGNAVAKAS